MLDLSIDQALGRSKGDLSTKIHATCDALGNPTELHLMLGQALELEGSDLTISEYFNYI